MDCKQIAILTAAALAGCATSSGERVTCSRVTSFAAPAMQCVAIAEPKPPPPAPPPPAPPTPEPEPEPPPPVVVTPERIELDRTVQFEPNSAILIDDSRALLDEVAKTLTDHPEIKQVQIEGHTDARMSKRHNRKLSAARARAVRDYLVERGIARDRLLSQGFGESRPVSDNTTWKGRFQNRRVELKILERDDGAAAAGGGD